MIAEVRGCLGAELARLTEELTERLTVDPYADPEVRQDSAISDLQGALQGRIRLLGNLLAGMTGLDSGAMAPDRIGYGTTVTLREVASDLEEVYTLVTGDFFNLEEGHVSLASPLGHALIGRAAGDTVTVTTPRGERRYVIVSATTLPQRLGLAPDSRRLVDVAGSMQVA